MKILKTAFLMILTFTLFAQDQVVGHYRNHFGSRIQLNADSTFEYTWHEDLSASWTKGNWTINNDTVYFRFRPIFDTISYRAKNGLPVDTLILSNDEIAERMTQDQYFRQGLSSGGQNYFPIPDKLFFNRQRLFAIKDGTLVKKKVRNFGTKKKWVPWFFKTDD